MEIIRLHKSPLMVLMGLLLLFYVNLRLPFRIRHRDRIFVYSEWMH